MCVVVLDQFETHVLRVLGSVNAKLGEFSRELRHIKSAIRSFKPDELPAESSSSTTGRAKMPCYSKYQLRALDSELCNDPVLFRETVSNFRGNFDFKMHVT
jgi:hypothetical protein